MSGSCETRSWDIHSLPEEVDNCVYLELQMPQETVWKRLGMIPYKLQSVQILSFDDKRVRFSFSMSMQQWTEDDLLTG